MTRKPNWLIFSFILTGTLIFHSALTLGQNFKASENEGWVVSIEEAYELSEKTNKPILANFTGSDWCGWCKKLKREVFSQPEFKEWAADNVILLELDYPRRTALPEAQRRQNAELQQAFRVTGFPTIWMFDLDKPDGKKFQIQPYGNTGYAAGGPSPYIKNLNRMIALKQKSLN